MILDIGNFHKKSKKYEEAISLLFKILLILDEIQN